MEAWPKERSATVHVQVGTSSTETGPRFPQASAPPRPAPWVQIIGAITIMSIFVAAAAALAVLASLGLLGRAAESGPQDLYSGTLDSVNSSSYPPAYYGSLHTYLNSAQLNSQGMSVDHDVIVIGAGLAGIAAATKLQAAGLSVVVLEARVRYRI